MGTLRALVLAAGAGSRMGGYKAARLWRGRSFAAHLLQACADSELGSPALVWGAHPLPHDLEGFDYRSLYNEQWERGGPLSSLQLGLRALTFEGGAIGVLVLSVDRPHLRPATLRTLREQALLQPRMIWQPEYEDRRGHPIYWPRALWPELCALDPFTATPREVVRAHEELRRFVPVGDPAVIENIDDPAGLALLASRA